MRVEESPFFREFLRTIEDAVDFGWHEYNGGNLSDWISPEEVVPLLDEFSFGEWKPLDVTAPAIADQFVLITAAGSFFRSIPSDPSSGAGIIQLDETGTHYRSCWGFAHGGRPTSELSMHMLNHTAKMLGTEGRNHVIYHAHPVNINALTFVLPLTSEAFTRELWTTISECALVFPRGIGVIPWLLPGSLELAVASAESLEVHDAVVWPHHGIFCAGDSFEEALGLIHTVEKAAEICVKVRSMTGGPGNRITEQQIRKLDAAFGLGIPEDYISAVFE